METTTTLIQAIELLKTTEDAEFSNIKRANALIPKFTGIPEAVALLDTLRSTPEAKMGAALTTWVEVAIKNRDRRIQNLKDEAKSLRKEHARIDATPSKRQLKMSMTSPTKKICTTKKELLAEFDVAGDQKETELQELQMRSDSGTFSQKEEESAKRIADLMNSAAKSNAGPSISKEAWNTCVRGILEAFAALKTTGRAKDLWTSVNSAMQEKVTMCIKPASQSLTQFANTTLNVLMLGIWVAAKVRPGKKTLAVRKLYQDGLVTQLKNGANQLESTTLMTVPTDPEETHRERCVQAIASNAGKPMPGQAAKKAKFAEIEYASKDEDSDSEAATALPARGKKSKGLNVLIKNSAPDHEKHFKSVTEETTSTFKAKRKAVSDSDSVTNSDEEDEKRRKQKEKGKAAREAKKKAKEDGAVQENAIANLAALAEPFTKLAQALLTQSTKTTATQQRPQANSGECFRDPVCTNPTCRWSHPKREASAGASAQGQAPSAMKGPYPDMAARIRKFSGLKACRNFHDLNSCKHGASCKLTHAKFNENGTPCKTHADKSAICEHSLRAQGCGYKHLF